MSTQSWKDAYYPIRALETKVENAVRHSVVKWIGLRKENLEDKGMTVSDRRREIYDHWESMMHIHSGTCALCFHHMDSAGDGFNPNEPESKNECSSCPLAISRNNVPCDLEFDGQPDIWGAWVSEGDPEPMIAALENLL